MADGPDGNRVRRVPRHAQAAHASGVPAGGGRRKQPAVDYVVAQRERAALRSALEAALEGVVAVVLPTSLTVAWRWDDLDADSMGVRNAAIKHLPGANLTGHPAISLPVASRGLPVGLGWLGRLGRDEALLDVAAWLERRVGSVFAERRNA